MNTKKKQPEVKQLALVGEKKTKQKRIETEFEGERRRVRISWKKRNRIGSLRSRKRSVG